MGVVSFSKGLGGKNIEHQVGWVGRNWEELGEGKASSKYSVKKTYKMFFI